MQAMAEIERIENGATTAAASATRTWKTSRTAVRALRTLQILQAKTDRDHRLSCDQIVAELENPNLDGLPSLPTANKSLYNAISSLRQAGYEVDYKHGKGYALTSQRLLDEDIEELARIVEGAAAVTDQRRRALLLMLGSIASPTARERLEQNMAAEEARRQTDETELPRTPMEPVELLRRAIDMGRHVSFECRDSWGGVAAMTLYPTALTERFGSVFVTGRLPVPPGNAGVLPSSKTFNVSRLNNLCLKLKDGTLGVAAIEDVDEGEAEAAPAA